MSAYIVRMMENHELVGFFMASNSDELFIVVDECVSPLEVEYRRVVNGGIMFCDPGIPCFVDDREDDWGEARPSPTEAVIDVMNRPGRWTRFTKGPYVPPEDMPKSQTRH